MRNVDIIDVSVRAKWGGRESHGDVRGNGRGKSSCTKLRMIGTGNDIHG